MPDSAHADHAPLSVTYVDDPRVVAEAAVDDYADHVVPLTARMGRYRSTMAWYSVGSAMFYVVTGAAVAASYGTKSACLGLLLTIAVYSVINAILSSVATETGLSVAMFSRSMFGLVGAALATLIFAATALYYFIFEGSIIAVAFQVHFGGDLRVWEGVVCIAGLLLVMRGVTQWLDKLNAVLLPLYLIGMIGAVVWAISKYGYSNAWWNQAGTVHSALPGWLSAFLVYMGIWVLMMFTMDFARLTKPDDKRYHSVVTFGPVFYVLAFGLSGFIGVFLATTVPLQKATGFGEAGAAVAIVQMMGFAGVALIFVTQARINTANLYLASSNLEAFMARTLKLRLPRTVWAVVAAALCWLFMVWNAVLEHLVKALAYQGVFITAWVAMALVHVAYVRRNNVPIEARPWRIPAINPGGFVSWIVSVAVGLFLITAPGVNATLVELAPLITVVVAATVYAVSLVVTKPHTREQGPDPVTEVDDPWGARILCAGCGKSYVAVEMDIRRGSGEVMCASCAQVHASAK